MDSTIGTSTEVASEEPINTTMNWRIKNYGTLQHIPLIQLRPDPDQVRKTFNKEAIDELIESIKHVGVLHPLRVHKNGKFFDIVDGGRRYLALTAMSEETAPCLVETGETTEEKAVHEMLISNCIREDLNPIEKAHGYSRLMSLSGCSAAETAKKLGTSTGSFAKILSLLRLCDAVQQKIASGLIPASSGYLLARIDDKELQMEIAEQISSGLLSRDAIGAAIKAKTTGARKDASVSNKPTSKATADLGALRSVTFAGPSLDIESAIEIAEEFLAQARRARTQGVGLATLCKILRDKSAAMKVADPALS